MTSRWVNPINNNILRDLQDNVLASGSLEFYAAGTSTPLAVYSDPELTVNLGSILTADAYGLIEDFHLAAGTQYKMVAKDSLGATKWTRDDVFSLDSSVDTRLDSLESSVASLSNTGRNSVQNGGCSAENLDTDKAVITAPNLTTSFAEGQVKGVFAKVANVTAGTAAIGYSADVESGAYLHLSGVTTNNAAATADAMFLVKSGEAARFLNKEATFRCKVYHDVGSAVNFTVTVAALNTRDDISAYTTILAGSATAVSSATWTTLTLTVPDMGNANNGIAIIVSGAVGTITTKNIRYSVGMMDIGGVLSAFTETDPNIVEPALNAQDFASNYSDAIARRDVGATRLNGIGDMEVITFGSGNYVVPAGVYRIKATLTGPGGGGGGEGTGAASGGNAGNTTLMPFDGAVNPMIAYGGLGGPILGADGDGVAGGTGTKGDFTGAALILDGGGSAASEGDASSNPGGASYWGGGGRGVRGETNGIAGVAYGSGGSGAVGVGSCSSGGSAGGTVIAILTVSPGDSLAYAIGSAGAAGAGTYTGGAGAPGVILLEY